MLAFFSMVLNGITIVLAFFSKFTAFSNSASILSNVRLFGRKALYVALIAAMLAYVVILVAFFYYMVESIVTAYNLISSMIDKMQNAQGGTTSPLIQGFYYFLNVTGVADAISAIFPFIASALSFRLLKALYQVILSVHWKLLNFYRVTVDGITAA